MQNFRQILTDKSTNINEKSRKIKIVIANTKANEPDIKNNIRKEIKKRIDWKANTNFKNAQ